MRVEADGVPQYRHTSVMLDLSNRAWFLQYVYVNVTETPIIPYDQDRYYVFGSNRARVSVVGDVVRPSGLGFFRFIHSVNPWRSNLAESFPFVFNAIESS